MLATWVAGALLLGLIARLVGSPPLVGFLGEGAGRRPMPQFSDLNTKRVLP